MTSPNPIDIELALAQRAGLDVAVEEDGDNIVLTGLVDNDELRQAALDIAWELAPGKNVEDNLEITATLSEQVAEYDLSEVEVGGFEGATADADEEPVLEAGDFTEQDTLTDANMASGPSTSLDDAVGDGDEVYVPPTDPVGNNTEVIGGLSHSSMDSIEVARSALDNEPGDEAMADAIRRELREDAATTDLDVRVSVRQAVARLRGRVADLEDTDNAMEVAARVPGIEEVIDEIEVEGM